MNFFSSAKDRKTTALSKKNTVSSVNGSYGIVVILAYLSPQGLTSAQPGGVHSAGNILFNSALPLLHCPCKQIQRTLPHTPDLLALRMGRFNVQDTGESSPEPLFPSCWHKRNAAVFSDGVPCEMP